MGLHAGGLEKMNRHNHKPTVYTVHLDRAMSRAKYMASHPNKQTVETWAGHMLAHFDECARLERKR